MSPLPYPRCESTAQLVSHARNNVRLNPPTSLSFSSRMVGNSLRQLSSLGVVAYTDSDAALPRTWKGHVLRWKRALSWVNSGSISSQLCSYEYFLRFLNLGSRMSEKKGFWRGVSRHLGQRSPRVPESGGPNCNALHHQEKLQQSLTLSNPAPEFISRLRTCSSKMAFKS